MGVKELWPLLTPYCERKPIKILQGKIIAIDLAGWVCESLNVVDFFIHPKQYMKNLFFRTCFILLEGILPVFVLEGKAPVLKAKIIQQRNEIQFRGVKPREKNIENKHINSKEPKGRTQFNYVLKNCELLLKCMGVPCIQAPGEAEAYCAFLNQNGFVDGIISQDSDCFAYGAVTVYRNFAVSAQGATSTQGGSVDIYDMRNICQKMDFGQNKVIALALFCGCDYNNGISGVGKDSVLKLFQKYNNSEILDRIKSWRLNDLKYSELEMKVNNKNICSNCGHLGKMISHSKSGCSVCRIPNGCLETSWKEEKLIIKAELNLRQKALQDLEFPSQDIINEFLFRPRNPTNLNLTWARPNIVKFIKSVGKLLQWTEVYCFKKFLPVLTRWQLQNKLETILTPDFIAKKRISKGIHVYEMVWKDDKKLFEGLIPNEQIQSLCVENSKEIQTLWTTIEPAVLIEKTYSELVENYVQSRANSKKYKTTVKKKECKNALDMNSLIKETKKITSKIKNTQKPRKGLQLIDKYFYKTNTPTNLIKAVQCSTPKKELTLCDLDNECSYEENNLSSIIDDIVSNSFVKRCTLSKFSTRTLFYETTDLKKNLDHSKDDLDLLPCKRKKQNYSSSNVDAGNNFTKSNSLNDISKIQQTNIDEFSYSNLNKVSFFFEKVLDNESDEFEKSVLVNLSDFNDVFD